MGLDDLNKKTDRFIKTPGMDRAREFAAETGTPLNEVTLGTMDERAAQAQEAKLAEHMNAFLEEKRQEVGAQQAIDIGRHVEIGPAVRHLLREAKNIEGTTVGIFNNVTIVASKNSNEDELVKKYKEAFSVGGTIAG